MFNQIVLTLQNERAVYDVVKHYVQAGHYHNFREFLDRSITVRSLTQVSDVSPVYYPKLRSIIMLWESYFKDSECPRSDSLDADRRKIASVNRKVCESWNTDLEAVIQYNQSLNQTSTSKEITMSLTNTTAVQFDASVPVANVTLVYGRPIKDYNDTEMLGLIGKLQGEIKSLDDAAVGSKRFAAKQASLKSDLAAVIEQFDKGF